MTTSFDGNLLIVRCGGNVVDLELAFILEISEWGLKQDRTIDHAVDFNKSVYPNGRVYVPLRLWVIFNTEQLHNFLGRKLLLGP